MKTPRDAARPNWFHVNFQTGKPLTRGTPAINWVASKSNTTEPKTAKQKKQMPKDGKRKRKPQNRTATITVRGRGGYIASGDKYQRGFAPDYGARLGSVMGEGLHSLAEVLGFGEYEVKQNSLLGNITLGTDPPTVRNTKRGEATIFTHREYIGDLKSGSFAPGGTSPFTIQAYPLNPGNSDLFPWLSTIAHNFQEWEPRGMIVELKSLSSNYAAGLSMGAMFAATQYNVLTPPPVSKIELENLEYSTSSKPSTTCLHAIECARGNDMLTHLYVASDANYQGGDARLYDLGNLYLGSFGIPVSDAPIAEIWVTYEIALYKPTLPESVGQFDTEHFLISGVSASAPQGVVTPMLGSSQVVNFTTSLISGSQASYEFTFPNKIARYLCVVNMNYKAGSTMSNTAWGFTSGSHTDCQLYFGWSDPDNGPNGLNISSVRNEAATPNIGTGSFRHIICTVIFDVPALTSGSLPVGRLTFLTSTGVQVVSGDVWVTQVSPHVN